MWDTDPLQFSNKYGITINQAKQLQCTGEHLLPHSLGGPATKANIVAACAYCNHKRHQRKQELLPVTYKLLVAKRLEKGRWHGFNLH
jgi:5-methylcytosine-specific restriction endonuclease McrA